MADAGNARTPWVGAPVKRVEDPRFFTGHGRYVDDIQLPGMLHVALLRSPYAHAQVRTIDVSRARALPGVELVMTGRDLERDTVPLGTRNPAILVRDYALALDKVRYVGHPVAAVVAVDRYVAEDALALIQVEYEELPAVTDPERAMQPDSPLVLRHWIIDAWGAELVCCPHD